MNVGVRGKDARTHDHRVVPRNYNEVCSSLVMPFEPIHGTVAPRGTV